MKNDYQIGKTKISIPPTILYSVIGGIKDVRKTVTMDAKKQGDLVYIIGETKDEMGGSEWFAMRNFTGNNIPRVDALRACKIYRALHKAIQQGIIASCHDCSDGGLAVALAEISIAGGLGMNIDLNSVPYRGERRDDYILFSESASRFIITIHPEAQSWLEKIMAGSIAGLIGLITNDGLFQITGLDGKLIIKEKISKLKEAWQKPLNF
jgi:phosphoribosylformylglycinamidine synthase